MINKRLAAVVIVLLLLVGAAIYKLQDRDADSITATGTIEITRADITPKVGGYITALTIKEGDKLTAGQIVARIARADLDAQLLRDELALSKAEAQLQDLEKGARPQERAEAVANLSAARAVRDKAQVDYQRYDKLLTQGAISTQQLDAARQALDVATGTVVALEQKLSLLVEGSRPDAIQAQRLEVERSKAVVAASKVVANDTLVPAPLDGLVMTKNFENNEYVNPGVPIATIGDMNDCWVKVYVASTELGLISVGQPVAVRVDSFPDKVFAGSIKEISQTAEFTPRQSITKRERANQVFAVKVQIDNAAGLLKPGMPADVVIK